MLETLSNSLNKRKISLELPDNFNEFDSGVKQFWNKESSKLHSKLWHPHHNFELNQINYKNESGEYWKDIITPTSDEDSEILVDLPEELVSFFEEGSIPLKKDGTPKKQSAKTIANKIKHKDTISKKIRIYPEDESLWINAINQNRRAYNLSIEMFKKGRKPSSQMRRRISRMLKHEGSRNGWVDNVNLVMEAYRSAHKTRTAVIKKRSQGEYCEYRFKSRKDSKQTFIVEKISPKKGIYPRVLGKCGYTEEIPEIAIGQNANVSWNNNQWYVSVKDSYRSKKIEAKGLKIVALDPGKRIFQTSYSATESVKYGDKFVENQLLPLMLKLDKLLSKRDFIKKHKSEIWKSQRLRGINNRIKKLRARQEHLVHDLHRRVSFDLVSKHDVILLPTFETQKMVKKSKKRKSNKQTARTLLGLAHYKFKETLKWMAKKYGKVVIDVNESFTSKTLWDGSIKTNLNGKHQFCFEGKKVNRDIHGARNILIRFLTKLKGLPRKAESATLFTLRKEKVMEYASPRETYSQNITNALNFYKNVESFGGFCVLK